MDHCRASSRMIQRAISNKFRPCTNILQIGGFVWSLKLDGVVCASRFVERGEQRAHAAFDLIPDRSNLGEWTSLRVG
jgi:hypothetical protein